MKYTLIQVGVLTAVVALAVASGHGVVASRWGPGGVSSLYAAAVICLSAALLAALPLGLAATYWQVYAPQVAFAGTAIRLLGTVSLGFAYQVLASPHRMSFLVCMLGLYLVLLVVETALIVWIVRRVFSKQVTETE